MVAGFSDPSARLSPNRVTARVWWLKAAVRNSSAFSNTVFLRSVVSGGRSPFLFYCDGRRSGRVPTDDMRDSTACRLVADKQLLELAVPEQRRPIPDSYFLFFVPTRRTSNNLRLPSSRSRRE
jgi:hypothetical protein